MSKKTTALQETFLDGPYGRKKRVYGVDEKGREYILYSDKKNKIVIREAHKEDAPNICSTSHWTWLMNQMAKKQGKGFDEIWRKNIQIMRDGIERYNSKKALLLENPDAEENLDANFIFERKSGKGENKFFGYGEVTTEKKDQSIAKIRFFLRDEEAIKTYKERLCDALANMCELYGVFDELKLISTDGETVERTIYPR